MSVKEFCKAKIFDFFQLLNSDYELNSYDEVESAFHMIPNNTTLSNTLNSFQLFQ